MDMTFGDLEHYKRSGSSKHGKPDPIFKEHVGKNCNLPEHRHTCLCGHNIVGQCYLCPMDSNHPNDIIILRNHCIEK